MTLHECSATIAAMNPTPQQLAAIANWWINQNQALIDAAVLDALSRLEDVARVLTDPGAKGDDLLRQEIAAAATAARGTLPEFMGEEFERKFATCSQQLRDTLKAQAERVVWYPHLGPSTLAVSMTMGTSRVVYQPGDPSEESWVTPM